MSGISAYVNVKLQFILDFDPETQQPVVFVKDGITTNDPFLSLSGIDAFKLYEFVEKNHQSTVKVNALPGVFNVDRSNIKRPEENF